MPQAVEDERRLRAEVALLTGLADTGWCAYAREEGEAGAEFDPRGIRRFPGGELISESVYVAGAGDSEDEALQRRLEGGLEAGRAAGLFSDEQVEGLREVTTLCRQPAKSLRATGERRGRLERLIEGVLEPVVSDQTGMADMRFHLVLDTATVLGLLDEDQRRHFEERLEQVYLEALENQVDDYDDVSTEPLIGFKGVAAGPPERGGRWLKAVECFDGGLLIRCDVTHELPEQLRGRPAHEVFERFRPPDDSFEMSVTDDTGARYRSGGGGGSSDVIPGHWVSSWCWCFSPGLSPMARTLTVALDGESFEVDVAGIAERASI